MAQKHGNYTDPNCTTVATKRGNPSHKGGFEWLGGGGASCYAMKHGNYADAGCTTVATKHGVPDHKGHFEKTGGGAFTSAGGTGVLYATVYYCEESLIVETCTGHNVHSFAAGVECESENGSGEAYGANGVRNIAVTFHGCYEIGVSPCSTPGAAEGEIKTDALKGELGYIAKATHKAGVVLHPASGTEFVKFLCAQYEEEVYNEVTEKYEGEGNGIISFGDYFTVGEGIETGNGKFYPGGGGAGIISPITPVNEMTPKYTQVYTKEGEWPTPTKNVPARFEEGEPGEGPLEALEMQLSFYGAPTEGDQWSPASESITNVNTTTEGPGEIKA